MKKIIKQYINLMKEFLSNKKYIIPFIVVTILSFGFAITHESVGVDDLCFNRYFKDTYILSQGRWATYILYNVLNITSFSPFWLEFLTTIVLFFTAIVICTFIKRQFGDKIPKLTYILLSCLYISYPISEQYFIYQITNFAIAISNILIIISAILLYENNYNIKSKKIFFLLGALITISIASYESCIQTFFVIIFFQVLMQAKFNKEKFKNLIIYVLKSVLVIAIGVTLYKIIGEAVISTLTSLGILQKDYALHNTMIQKIIEFGNDISARNATLHAWLTYIVNLVIKSNKPYIVYLVIAEIIALVLGIYESIEEKNCTILLSILGMIFSNYIFTILMELPKLRTNYSWTIAFALLIVYIYQVLWKNKILNKISICAIILIILSNSRYLNNAFYEEYLGYEKNKSEAYKIAQEILIQCKNTTKPVCYVKRKVNLVENEKYLDRISIIKWAINAFDEKSVEITKFINSLGYNFSYITNDEYEEAKKEYRKIMNDVDEKQWVVELEKYIIVNLAFIE